MRRQRPIVVVGSINTDLVSVTARIPAVGETVFGTDFQIHPGGKGANQAVAVARLGYPVQMIGRVGSDHFGEQLRKHLENCGVDTTGIAISEGATGTAAITVSASGDNSIVVTSGANHHLTPQDVSANIEIIRRAGLVLAQLEIPIETVEHLALLCARNDIPFILDPAPAVHLPRGLLEHVEWFTPNQTEAAFFVDGEAGDGSSLEPSETSQLLMELGICNLVLKMGAKGVYLRSLDGFRGPVPAFPVKALDTTAAGDAFNGGFATALMLGQTPLESARFASAVAAISVTRSGAQPSMPSMAEVEQFLQCTTLEKVQECR